MTKKSPESSRDPAPQIPHTTFSIEEVVLGGALLNDGLEFQRNWKLIFEPALVKPPDALPRKSPDVKGDKNRKKRLRSPSEPRSVDQSCGTTLVALLRENLPLLAAMPTQKIVRKPKRASEKFASNLRRIDVARALKTMNPELAIYGDSTIVKALSALVECPKGKRGGRSKREP